MNTETSRTLHPATTAAGNVSFRSRVAGLTLLIFICFSYSAAQTPQIDSLKRALPETAGKERLGVLFALANQLEGIKPQQGLKYALEGIPLAQTLRDSASEATLYSSAGYSSTELGDYKQAVLFGFRSLELSTLIGDKTKVASAHSTLGIAFAYIGQFSKALEHHFEALRLREELGLVLSSAATLNNIGIAYHRIGHYDEAI